MLLVLSVLCDAAQEPHQNRRNLVNERKQKSKEKGNSYHKIEEANEANAIFV